MEIYEKEIKIKKQGITFRLTGEDINIKAIAEFEGVFMCAFNCGTKYIDAAEEFVNELVAEMINYNRGLFEVVKQKSHTLYNEEEIKEFFN
jgi:hypothetical protein